MRIKKECCETSFDSELIRRNKYLFNLLIFNKQFFYSKEFLSFSVFFSLFKLKILIYSRIIALPLTDNLYNAKFLTFFFFFF